MQKKVSVGIVGGGVSGLRVAHLCVQQCGNKLASITIYESQTKLGGALQSTKQNGYLLEHGAQAMLSAKPSFERCLQNLNLNKKTIEPPAGNLKRFLITAQYTLVPALQLWGLLRSRTLSVFSLSRILLEFFVRNKTEKFNETCFDFFARRFGVTFATIFFIPLSFGIWGGGAKSILLRHVWPQLQAGEKSHGSVLRFLLAMLLGQKEKKENHLGSFPNGMMTLIEELETQCRTLCAGQGIEFKIETQTMVTKIVKKENQFHVSFQGQKPHATHDIVVYTGQPWRDLDVEIGSHSATRVHLQTLRNIPSHSLAVVGLGGKLPNKKSPPKGLGALAPASSKDLLGVLFVHSLFPAHVPKGSFLYRVMLGGEACPTILSHSNEELIELAHAHLEKLQLIEKNTPPDFTSVIRWENYIPLPTEQHDACQAALWQIEALEGGLFFAGNYIQGVAVADCLLAAEQCVERMHAFLTHTDEEH